MSDQTCNLTDQPPEMMRMVSGLSRMFRAEMRRACETNGIPVGYRGILFHLSREDGVTQKALAEKTDLKPSTISITLDKMEREGYIYRVRDSKDARALHVFLTEKGMEINRKNREKIAQLEARFSSVVTPEERAQLMALVQKVIEGYRRQCAEALTDEGATDGE